MRISKLETAKQQLEVACELYLKRASIFAVHTLAGAAEDILGALATRQGHTNMFERMRVAGEEMLNRKLSNAEVSGLINDSRNALKHARDPAEDTFFYDTGHGLVMLFRALVNFQLVTGGLTNVMERTRQDLHATQPLFLPPNQRPVT
ncbi:hypothetical protein [Lysobacter xanthus]